MDNERITSKDKRGYVDIGGADIFILADTAVNDNNSPNRRYISPQERYSAMKVLEKVANRLYELENMAETFK